MNQRAEAAGRGSEQRLNILDCVIPETVRACGLQEPKDEADNLHQRQDGRVCQRLVR